MPNFYCCSGKINPKGEDLSSVLTSVCCYKSSCLTSRRE